MTSAEPLPRWRRLLDEARAAIAGGHSRAAPALLEPSLRLNPHGADAWRLMADLRAAAGDVPGALAALDAAARPAEPRLAAPLAALVGGRLDEAARAIAAVLAERPSAPALALMGETLRRQGRLAEAGAVLASALTEDREWEPARRSLVLVLFAERRFEDAASALVPLLVRRADDALALVLRAAALTEIGLYAEAAVITGEVLAAFPDQPHAWLVHASALRTLGDTEACIAAYLTCIELEPGAAEAWLSLANLKTYRFSPTEQQRMQALIDGSDLPSDDLAKLCFALGKAREDAGDYTQAIASYARGNAIERPRRAFDPAATTAYVRRSKTLFSPGFFASRAGWGASAPDPIFIVGLPRSGSTLVEQILASHPAVEGADELPDLPMIASGVAGYPDGLARLPRETCLRLGEDYLRRTRAYRHLGRPRFIDKTPKNFLHIGFIRLILPNARIIDVRRHPLDCGVSIYRQYFGHGFSCAFDLEHIGRYYADYVDLLAHVDEVLPGSVHRVIYETLIEDTQSQVRRLLDYLGLAFDPACLRFFENRRPVDTPSAEQVRRPIFSDSVGQWRNFEPLLAPLRSALGPVLDAYPAAPAAGARVVQP